LIESLTVLTADASVQVAWAKECCVVTDEIALDFDHAFRMVERLAEEDHIGLVALPDLREIDLIFSEMSGVEHADRSMFVGGLPGPTGST
jgi:hypothetical protein